MATLMIVYEARTLGTNHHNLLSEIHKYPLTRITPFAYMIQTNCSRTEVFGLLQRHLSSDDTLYVMEVSHGLGWGHKASNRFLAEHLNGVTSETLH
jgi:hypothetical protein